MATPEIGLRRTLEEQLLTQRPRGFLGGTVFWNG
jgi:hypothetical protein